MSATAAAVTDRPYFDDPASGVRLYLGDCFEILPHMREGSIDMVFADPPYFLSNGGITCHAGKRVSVDKGAWDRSPGIASVHEFNIGWLQQCQRVLQPNGTIWVSGTTHAIFSVGLAMQQLGFKILNDITWFKRNAAPNLSCRYFTHSTEHIVWAAPSEKSRHTFHYQLMKQINGGKQMRDVWTMSAPAPGEKRHGKHPTQKPLALLDRIIRASTEEGDLVLDPFCGSGTTAVAALGSGRRAIGIDSEAKYLQLAVKRIADVLNQPKLL